VRRVRSADTIGPSDGQSGRHSVRGSDRWRPPIGPTIVRHADPQVRAADLPVRVSDLPVRNTDLECALSAHPPGSNQLTHCAVGGLSTTTF